MCKKKKSSKCLPKKKKKKIKCPVDRDHLTKRPRKVIRNSAEWILREITFVNTLRKIDTSSLILFFFSFFYKAFDLLTLDFKWKFHFRALRHNLITHTKKAKKLLDWNLHFALRNLSASLLYVYIEICRNFYIHIQSCDSRDENSVNRNVYYTVTCRARNVSMNSVCVSERMSEATNYPNKICVLDQSTQVIPWMAYSRDVFLLDLYRQEQTGSRCTLGGRERRAFKKKKRREAKEERADR